ncbi:MAG: hypothetical protein U1A23_01885 [Candidatus Sungbacteria bacterium]|nr:hypothetical protein [bacterium]MDZ4285657.1 hypothetical protein [Candidatus Sungbacteria bacterium]
MEQKDVQQLIDAMQEVFPTAEMVKRGFDEVDKRFDEVDKRLDRIENLILKRHEQDIEELKIRIRYVEDMLAVPLKK